MFLSLTIAILVESLGVVGSGVSAVSGVFFTSRATRTLNLGVGFCVAGVASLVGVTSVSSLPTSVVFCVASFAFGWLSLSCVATTFSSALVVVAEAVESLEAGVPLEAWVSPEAVVPVPD